MMAVLASVYNKYNSTCREYFVIGQDLVGRSEQELLDILTKKKMEVTKVLCQIQYYLESSIGFNQMSDLSKDAKDDLYTLVEPSKDNKSKRKNMVGGKFTKVKFFKGEGCYHCKNTGYLGRIGVYEWLELDDDLLVALRDQNHNAFIDAAKANPLFKTMEEFALEYAQAGITHLDEVFRISVDLDDFHDDIPIITATHPGGQLDD
jgi:type II secretory ATPase GspE/PulE/Tfp pilus assembly ATPase PilB-like protein